MPAPFQPESSSPLQAINEQIRAQSALTRSLYEQCAAARWSLSFEQFLTILGKSAASRFKAGKPAAPELESYLSLLHFTDLALAAGCAQGNEAAWEHFVTNYRPYLRSAAAAILRRSIDSAEVCELADALFGDLYGIKEDKPGRGSLLNYFHGRSKLSTWLRTVLAQRHIDAIRAGKRWESLDEPEVDGHPHQEAVAVIGPLTTPDPHREKYLTLLSAALTQAMQALDKYERLRLTEYYLRDKTLAAIGRELSEHEATVSRKLERTRKELRQRVEKILRSGAMQVNGYGIQPGLDDAQIALCFEYALEDWPVDLSKVLDSRGSDLGSVPSRQQPVAKPLPESS